MQNRFKFRVWDKKNKCLHSPTLYSNFTIVNGTVVKVAATNNTYLSNRIALEIDDAVIMQCTGKKDKNGKLIYEGDLLKPLSEDDERVEVVWNEEKARFGLMIQWTDYCYWNGLYEETKTGRDYYELDDYYAEDFEVIGNVYENPELLEIEND